MSVLDRCQPQTEAEQAVLDKIRAAYKKGTDSIQESNDTGSPCA